MVWKKYFLVQQRLHLASVCRVSQDGRANTTLRVMFCGENKAGAGIDCKTSEFRGIGLCVSNDDSAELHLKRADEDEVVDRV